MAITQEVQDLINFPGNTKRITLDVDSIVPTDAEGDEKMMLVASTAGYSNNVNRTAIQAIYVLGGKIGWSKSSGLAGAAGKFALDSSNYKLRISMDATVSGTSVVGDRGYYEIDLDYNIDTTSKSGENIAEDMQEKIRALTMVTADTGFQLAYTNSSVSFSSGKFYISSGTIADSYIDDDRSSVKVLDGATLGAATILGFDHQVTSEDVAGTSIAESAITSNYTGGTTPLSIGANTGVSSGDALYVTDGVNGDYFTALAGTTDTSIVVATIGNNSFDGISNNYTTSSGSYVQILKKQDPDVEPNNYFDDMDGVLRYMSKSLINQLDFSS
jgi:hypothetical protein